ncbi:alpha/beta hydrolase [Oryzicola mucosus]|uniref:alpha/beta hydrolase n=1 Tax=Oryzicola mucosus TaxID=2767425 RepID=UPI002EDAF905
MPSPKYAVALLSLFLAGCINQPAQELLTSAVVAAPVTQIAGAHAIFITTTRGAAEDQKQVFAGDRSATLNYAMANVTVPLVHKSGQIEQRGRRDSADQAKFFTATNVTAYDTQPKFMQAINADIAARGERVMVFVHGYNTGFDSAVYRVTQVVHDSGYTGTPVLFSWASGGTTSGYVYDRESASVARDQLEVTLRMLAQSGARRIDIIAHSMGTWVTMETLRQLAITGDRDLGGKLGDVVLASPDIDVDVFKSQMRRYGKPTKPFVLLLSADDRALKLSGLLAGAGPRLGGYRDAADLARYGVQVIDLSTETGSDPFNHNKFADNPALIRLLGQRLREDDGFATDRDITDRIKLLQ